MEQICPCCHVLHLHCVGVFALEVPQVVAVVQGSSIGICQVAQVVGVGVATVDIHVEATHAAQMQRLLHQVCVSVAHVDVGLAGGQRRDHVATCEKAGAICIVKGIERQRLVLNVRAVDGRGNSGMTVRSCQTDAWELCLAA